MHATTRLIQEVCDVAIDEDEWILDTIKRASANNPHAITRLNEIPSSTWIVLMPAEIYTVNGFFWEVNDSKNVGTTTAKKACKVPWLGVRLLP